MKPSLWPIALGCVFSWFLRTASAAQLSGSQAPSPSTDAAPGWGPEAQAFHVLNRLGYGPRPGDIRAIEGEGVKTWINRQLDPQSISDPVADAALARLGTLDLPCSTLVQAYREEAVLRRERQKRLGQQAAATTDAGPAPHPIKPPPVDPPEQLLATAFAQFQEAKLIRAVLSNRQLNEVLVDFWFNHFNVDARKELDRATVESYERDTIRPHVWGTFRELLGATAHSPAMLVYLDNWKSSRVLAIRRRPGGPVVARRGLNENYGREIMELHTLGVDGGYTQDDVIQVARCLTGWTINPANGSFRFLRYWHDQGPKVVLGVRIPPDGGISDGEHVLDLLASSPATARHISRELCQRFVADNPPADLVNRVAAVFLATHGSLPAVYRCLFTSPEFLGPQYAGDKTKSPFEFVASALRATGAKIEAIVPNPPASDPTEAPVPAPRPASALARTALVQVFQMGQTPYSWEPPTGFSENSSRWITSGALVQRFNFTLAFSSGWFRDARPDYRTLLAGVRRGSIDDLVDALDRRMLGSTLTPATRRVLCKQTITRAHSNMTFPNIPRLVALILGSPEFQRR